MATLMPHVYSSSFNEEFQKGKPTVLGVLTIITAFVQIGLETVLICIAIFGLPSFISYWGPAFYIIGGSLAIAASSKQDAGLVKATMAFNIITSILSIIALILSIIDIISFCSLIVPVCSHENALCWRIIVGVAIFAIILFTNALHISMSITICVFARRALNQAGTQSSTQVFVIHNEAIVPVVQGAVATFHPYYTQPPSTQINYVVNQTTEKNAM